ADFVRLCGYGEDRRLRGWQGRPGTRVRPGSDRRGRGRGPGVAGQDPALLHGAPRAAREARLPHACARTRRAARTPETVEDGPTQAVRARLALRRGAAHAPLIYRALSRADPGRRVIHLPTP